MLITLEQLEACTPHSNDRRRIEAIEPLNATLEKYRINTIPRIAAFLAQVTHESGSFKYREEIASGKAYEYRRDLGNLDKAALAAAHRANSTTGKFYKGRGWIQITGYYNYKECSKAFEEDFVNNPYMLSEFPYAALSAGWFWDTHNCNIYADVGDFNKTTRIINGGWNGKEERQSLYINNLKVLTKS